MRVCVCVLAWTSVNVCLCWRMSVWVWETCWRRPTLPLTQYSQCEGDRCVAFMSVPASSGPCHTCPLHTCLHHTYLSSVFTLTFEHPHQSTHSHLDIHTNTPTLTHQHLCTHYTFVHPYTFSPTHLHLHFPMNSTHTFTCHTDTYTSAPFSFSDYLWGFSPFIPSLASVLFSFIP